jgi:hypothetical protein
LFFNIIISKLYIKKKTCTKYIFLIKNILKNKLKKNTSQIYSQCQWRSGKVAQKSQAPVLSVSNLAHVNKDFSQIPPIKNNKTTQ